MFRRLFQRGYRWFCYGLISGCGVVTAVSAADGVVQPQTTLQQTRVNQHMFKAIAVNPNKLRLYWQDENGKPYDNFSRLKNTLAASGQAVKVMMNAGIYGSDDKPAGLHIENHHQQHAINRRAGKGNFHLQPNGVFYITKNGSPAIRRTASFYRKYGDHPEKRLRLATQSGPMLLINGKINPRFKPNSGSLYSRNGVCVSKDDRVLFLATGGFSKSNLYDFAQAAKQFGCHNALYLDGSISKLYINGENSIFHWGYFVGILAEIE